MSHSKVVLQALVCRAQLERERAIVDSIKECPDLLYCDIAKAFGITEGRIGQLAVKHQVQRPRGPKMPSIVVKGEGGAR